MVGKVPGPFMLFFDILKEEAGIQNPEGGIAPLLGVSAVKNPGQFRPISLYFAQFQTPSPPGGLEMKK
jgi:hypothetical protein